MKWTDEIKDRLRELWSQGLSARQIGNEIGVDKNSVLGAAHRLGLPKHNYTIAREARRGNPMVVAVPRARNSGPGLSRPRKPPMMPPPDLEEVTGGVSFMEAKKYQCREVIGRDEPPFGLARFCGNPVYRHDKNGQEKIESYCPKHYAINYERPRYGYSGAPQPLQFNPAAIVKSP
jgi:GcrA cell cycle regulator